MAHRSVYIHTSVHAVGGGGVIRRDHSGTFSHGSVTDGQSDLMDFFFSFFFFFFSLPRPTQPSGNYLNRGETWLKVSCVPGETLSISVTSMADMRGGAKSKHGGRKCHCLLLFIIVYYCSCCPLLYGSPTAHMTTPF